MSSGFACMVLSFRCQCSRKTKNAQRAVAPQQSGRLCHTCARRHHVIHQYHHKSTRRFFYRKRIFQVFLSRTLCQFFLLAAISRALQQRQIRYPRQARQFARQQPRLIKSKQPYFPPCTRNMCDNGMRNRPFFILFDMLFQNRRHLVCKAFQHPFARVLFQVADGINHRVAHLFGVIRSHLQQPLASRTLHQRCLAITLEKRAVTLTALPHQGPLPQRRTFCTKIRHRLAANRRLQSLTAPNTTGRKAQLLANSQKAFHVRSPPASLAQSPV